jgi:4-carboxymuconolactone decarboxylase
MVTIGVLAALGQADLLEIQFASALERGELTEEQVRELVLHLAHYIGWPLSTGVNAAAEKIIARRAKAAAAAADTTPAPTPDPTTGAPA